MTPTGAAGITPTGAAGITRGGGGARTGPGARAEMTTGITTGFAGCSGSLPGCTKAVKGRTASAFGCCTTVCPGTGAVGIHTGSGKLLNGGGGGGRWLGSKFLNAAGGCCLGSKLLNATGGCCLGSRFLQAPTSRGTAVPGAGPGTVQVPGGRAVSARASSSLACRRGRAASRASWATVPSRFRLPASRRLEGLLSRCAST
mmetsp:Transcript_5161/g.16645  ORF Transcript_5161/g.16645 Transcript_5161/m.16645 type:complete len:201 (+) Transcript_5161:575-1177(+)